MRSKLLILFLALAGGASAAVFQPGVRANAETHFTAVNTFDFLSIDTLASQATVTDGSTITPAVQTIYIGGAISAPVTIELPEMESGQKFYLKDFAVTNAPLITFDGGTVRRSGQADTPLSTLQATNGNHSLGISYDGTYYRLIDTFPGVVDLATGVTGVLPAANGGAGTVSGLLKANGSGTVSQAVAGTDYLAASAINNTAYNATSWNGNADAPTKDAVRDKIETMSSGVGAVGWLPFVVAFGYDLTDNLDASSTSLVANGGSVAVPMVLEAPMLAEVVKWRNRDTTLTRSVEFRLFLQTTNSGSGDNTLAEVSGFNGSDSFTASAASNRSVTLASPVTLQPGAYWLVIRNTDASNTYLIGAVAASGTSLSSLIKTKTIGSSLGSTLDFATSWSSTNTSPGIIILGRVFGQSTVYP